MNAWQAFRAIALFCAGVILGSFGDLTTRLSQREQARLEESTFRANVARLIHQCVDNAASNEKTAFDWTNPRPVIYISATSASIYRAIANDLLECQRAESLIEEFSAFDQERWEMLIPEGKDYPPNKRPAVEELPAPVTDLRA